MVFFWKKSEEAGLPLNIIELASVKGDKSYFNRIYSFGFSSKEDEAEIYLIDPVKQVKHPIVNKAGNFVNFPGIENENLLKPYYKGDTAVS